MAHEKHKKHETGFDKLIELFEQTQTAMQAQAVRSIDIALVVRNWLFGWYIIEYQQNGADRAEYGCQLLKHLSLALSKSLGKGFSVDSLELMRKFYTAYQITLEGKSETVSRISDSISETASRELIQIPELLLNITKISQILSAKFRLGWSHYITLLTIKSLEERRFYEIEAAENCWSIRELKRQMLCVDRPEAGQTDSSGFRANADVCELL